MTDAAACSVLVALQSQARERGVACSADDTLADFHLMVSAESAISISAAASD